MEKENALGIGHILVDSTLDFVPHSYITNVPELTITSAM